MTDKEKMKKETEQGEANRQILWDLAKEGKLPEPRALTRRERKSLDAAGVNIFKIDPNDKRSLPQVREECADWILDNVFKDFDFDLPNNICLWFGSYVFGLSYRDDLTEKN